LSPPDLSADDMMALKSPIRIHGVVEKGELPWQIEFDTIKKLLSYPKCRSVEVINNPVRPGSNHREMNYIKL
jgi:hypothetical protein